MMGGMMEVALCRVSVVGGLLVVPGFVVFCRFVVMVGCFLVVICRFAMMFCCFFGHE